MLDSHLGVPDAVPEADAWRTGSYLASMDRALLLFDFDPAGLRFHLRMEARRLAPAPAPHA